MPDTKIYHITNINNLSDIISSGGLHADSSLHLAGATPTVIGMNHIKLRRMTEIKVPCVGNGTSYVGDFVPFYFCPRSPMLYTINIGKTGLQPGCQTDIVHLVSCVSLAKQLSKPWAYSSGNAGAYLADFYNDNGLSELDWDIINSNTWGGDVRRDKKAAEFLVEGFYPWELITQIGCYNIAMKQKLDTMLINKTHTPNVEVRPNWYY